MTETGEKRLHCDFDAPLPLVPGPRILVARHGATPWNGPKGSPEDRVRGWTDLPMTKAGDQEARQSAAILAKTGIQYVLTCPLQRTVKTGGYIAAAAGVEHTTTRALLPWNMGDLQGQPAQEAKPLLRFYAEHAPGKTLPGGESFNDWCERALPWLRTLMDGVQRRGLVVCLVTHSRNLNLYMGWLKEGREGNRVDIDALSKGGTMPGAIYDMRPAGERWEGKLICAGGKS